MSSPGRSSPHPKIPRVSTPAPSLATCEAETVTLFHCGSEGVPTGSHLLPEAFPDSTSPCCPGKALTLDRQTSWWLDPTCDGPALCGAWPAGLPPLPSSPPAPDPGDSGTWEVPTQPAGAPWVPGPAPGPVVCTAAEGIILFLVRGLHLVPGRSGKVSERPAPQPAARRGARVRLLRGRPATCQCGLTPRSHPEPHLSASVCSSHHRKWHSHHPSQPQVPGACTTPVLPTPRDHARGDRWLPARGPRPAAAFGPLRVAGLAAAPPGCPCHLNHLPQSPHFPVSPITALRMKSKVRDQVTCLLGSHSGSFPGFHTPLAPATGSCRGFWEGLSLSLHPRPTAPTLLRVSAAHWLLQEACPDHPRPR
ncbi:uncharacterized protein AAEQ78_010385 [Lycaon pictus]